MSGLSNRLTVLAAEIKTAHEAVQAAAKTAAERAIEAGKALIEAKSLVKHGEWLPWLKEHCCLAERTAQLYMRIAEKGAPADLIAALGLKAVATSTEFLGFIDYWSDVPEEAQREWSLYTLMGCHPDYVCWLRRRGYMTPDEWLGEEGAKDRRGLRRLVPTYGEPSDQHKQQWAAFKAEYKDKTKAEIDAEIEAGIAAGKFRSLDEPATAPKRRRRRPKSAPVADLPPATPEPKKPSDLAERLRALLTQNDPDKQRAEIAAIAAELEARQ